MSEIEKFKNEIRNTAHKYREAGRVCGQAVQLSDVVERRIASILDISRSIMPLNPGVNPSLDASVSSTSPLQEFTDMCLRAKEATPAKTELINLDSHDYPSLELRTLSNARCMEELVDATQGSSEAAQLVQNAFERFAIAVTELGQARDLIIHSTCMMDLARGAGESIADDLELFNHSF